MFIDVEEFDRVDKLPLPELVLYLVARNWDHESYPIYSGEIVNLKEAFIDYVAHHLQPDGLLPEVSVEYVRYLFGDYITFNEHGGYIHVPNHHQNANNLSFKDYLHTKFLLEYCVELYNSILQDTKDGDIEVMPSGLYRTKQVLEHLESRQKADFELLSAVDVTNDHIHEVEEQGSNPAAPYLADMFELINGVYYWFWEKWIEDTPRPKQQDVVAWLQKQDSTLTKQTAEAIYELSRPPAARKAGAPKAQQSPSD